MCTCTWIEEETRSWKISPQKISPFTSSWSHSEKWILRWEHNQRVKSTEPPIFKMITQRSPYLYHLAEAVKHWTSFYLSWPPPGRKRMKLSKHKRGDSVHSKPGLAWGQSPKSKGTARNNEVGTRMLLRSFICFFDDLEFPKYWAWPQSNKCKFHILQSQTDDLGIIPDSLDKWELNKHWC